MIKACLRLKVHILENVISKIYLLINTVFVFQDERLLEYDIDKLVFEARSPYQKVQIVHSKSLGNLLVLDELQSKENIIKQIILLMNL